MKETEDNDDNDNDDLAVFNQPVHNLNNKSGLGIVKAKINTTNFNCERKKASLIRTGYVSYSTLINKRIQNDRFYLITSISSKSKTLILIKGINSIKEDDIIYIHPIIMQIMDYPDRISISLLEDEM